jgi:RNA polymerase sporulation-specific sigma factor
MLMRTRNGTARIDGLGSAPTADRDQEDLGLLEMVKDGHARSIEVLLDRYRWLARFRARKFFIPGATQEDILQEAMVGLFNAIRNFDPSKKTPFAPFADMCINRQLRTALKTNKRHKHGPLNSAISLDASSHTGGRVESRIDRLAPPTTDPAVLAVSAQQVEEIQDHLIRTLTDLERDVLELMLEGNSYQQMADVLGKHVKSIDNTLQRIRAKLGAHLASDELS